MHRQELLSGTSNFVEKRQGRLLLAIHSVCVCLDKLKRRQLYMKNLLQVYVENAVLFALIISIPLRTL